MWTAAWRKATVAATPELLRWAGLVAITAQARGYVLAEPRACVLCSRTGATMTRSGATSPGRPRR